MAHFAQLDENNVVIQVIVISNEDTSDINGDEVEEIGIAFCKHIFGNNTRWKQTSYTGRIRYNFAGIGYYYDEELDAFIPPKPYPSWILDKNITEWKAPVSMPIDENNYQWNEENKNWESY